MDSVRLERFAMVSQDSPYALPLEHGTRYWLSGVPG